MFVSMRDLASLATLILFFAGMMNWMVVLKAIV